jgi:cobalt-precorrin-5B (C1)-methyltransferase
MAMGAVARVAAEAGFAQEDVEALRAANTVEAVIEGLRQHKRANELWCAVERRIAAVVHSRLQKVDRVEVRLFGLQGVALGQAA